MRFDLISIFPNYFAVLDLSLLGKAKQDRLVDIHVHDLREWATGRHRSVDDTPAGGGAGMVMRADVWQRAIDSVRGDGAVVAIPTPSGKPLTQRDLEGLASQKQIILACGRYEGIDSRVAEHYRALGVDVREFSLGDYVLNGGEVAALALVEGVSRLVPGVVGNPESLAEESHGADGLLEYPVYTQPQEWEGIEVPAVLRSGDHRKIRRWRRDQSLLRTARRRPDLIEALLESDPGVLDKRDREVLALEGITGGPRRPRFSVATTADLGEVSEFAARTFPLACPPSTTDAEIAGFVSAHLSREALDRCVRDGARIVICRDGEDGPILGYALMEREAPADLGTAPRSAAYLSKLYTDPGCHGTGISGALLERSLRDAVDRWGVGAVALGTNRRNQRAAKFYRRHGFAKMGERRFEVGGRLHHDLVFSRDLGLNPPL